VAPENADTAPPRFLPPDSLEVFFRLRDPLAQVFFRPQKHSNRAGHALAFPFSFENSARASHRIPSMPCRIASIAAGGAIYNADAGTKKTKKYPDLFSPLDGSASVDAKCCAGSGHFCADVSGHQRGTTMEFIRGLPDPAGARGS